MSWWEFRGFWGILQRSLYAFADKLRTSEGCVCAASDNRFAGHTADMGVAVGYFCLIAVATY